VPLLVTCFTRRFRSVSLSSSSDEEGTDRLVFFAGRTGEDDESDKGFVGFVGGPGEVSDLSTVSLREGPELACFEGTGLGFPAPWSFTVGSDVRLGGSSSSSVEESSASKALGPDGGDNFCGCAHNYWGRI